jgi:hypothetical protein
MGARVAALLLVACVFAAPVLAQRPQPFPDPDQRTAAPLVETLVPELPTLPSDPNSPTDATMGMPIYPTAQFISSYDAGRGQRYYVFGTTATFDSIVAYYRTQLDERGDRVFDEPPAHVFEVGRFNDDTMAFPPGVTVKDWLWGGSAGYPNPHADPESSQPARFPTVFVMVPPPTALTGR